MDKIITNINHFLRQWLHMIAMTVAAFLCYGNTAWGQEPNPVVFQNATIPGYCMAWVEDGDDGCRVVFTDLTFQDTKQQWVIEDAGGGYVYLKNVYSQTYLGRKGNNNWTMTFYTEEQVMALENDHAKFQFTNIETGGRFTIKTSYNLLSPNADYTTYNGAVFADKTTTNAHAY